METARRSDDEGDETHQERDQARRQRSENCVKMKFPDEAKTYYDGQILFSVHPRGGPMSRVKAQCPAAFEFGNETENINRLQELVELLMEF